MIKEKPAEFVKMVAQLVPKDYHIQQSMDERTNPIAFVLDPTSALAQQLHEAGSVVIDDLQEPDKD
jgi:hypothetical protein